MIAHNVGLPRSTLDENLRDAGLSYKLVRKAAAERDEKAREAWRAYVARNYVPSMMVFVDETSKDNRTIYCHYGRAVLGHRANALWDSWLDRKSTRLNSSHSGESRMPSSA